MDAEIPLSTCTLITTVAQPQSPAIITWLGALFPMHYILAYSSWLSQVEHRLACVIE